MNDPSTTTAVEPRKLAFIGLGVMGYPMARHLAQAGHAVTVYNRNADRARQWQSENGGQTAGSPREAAEGCDIVFACVGQDKDVEAIALGDDGAYAGMAAGAVFVDHTTASAVCAKALHSIARDRGLQAIDAPVSGGQIGAENGVLTVMCGGDGDAFAIVAPVAKAYARAITLLGPAGSGQLAKMVNQICIAGLVQGLSEGIAFGEKAGLDMADVLAVIGKGAAQSWQMDNRGTTMIDDRFDFGFAVDWMRKDLRLALEESRANGAKLPVTALVDQLYAEVQSRGGGRWDTSSLIRLLRG